MQHRAALGLVKEMNSHKLQILWLQLSVYIHQPGGSGHLGHRAIVNDHWPDAANAQQPNHPEGVPKSPTTTPITQNRVPQATGWRTHIIAGAQVRQCPAHAAAADDGEHLHTNDSMDITSGDEGRRGDGGAAE